MALRLGCSGWAYDDWRGTFYAATARPEDYLGAYARVYDVVEIDSTFYQAPSRERVVSWRDRTPDGFTFSPKVPQGITHEKKLGAGAGEEFEEFASRLEPLRMAGKLGPIVLQLPPTFTRTKHASALSRFLDDAPRHVDLAVELRHPSWWHDETYATLTRSGRGLVWSTNETGRTPPVPIPGVGYVYTRFIGDRALDAVGGRWTHVQRANPTEVEAYRAALMGALVNAQHVFVIANNHFLGHAPSTTKLLAEALEAAPPDITAAAREPGQRGLGAFGNE